MSFRVRLGDVLITVTTTDELRTVLEILSDIYPDAFTLERAAKRAATRPARPGLEPLDPELSFPDRFKTFLSRLSPNQRQVLECLVNFDEGCTDVELRERLELADNRELGGTLAGISKNAKFCELNFDAIIRKTVSRKGGGASYEYRLNKDLRSYFERTAVRIDRTAGRRDWQSEDDPAPLPRPPEDDPAPLPRPDKPVLRRRLIKQDEE